ncbi:MAG: s-methyl-5-thioribose-1-phosphate isomerase, partial [Methylotenera sp.]
TVDYGTALSPIYAAHDAGLEVHVWVDETRPRNQGASLTAWELAQHGVPHTVITDNAGGHLMQQGQVDMVLVGADRVSRNGDVCNKIGTYLKALAAYDSDAFGHEIPFYSAVPSPTIDWQISDGIQQIEIEERHADELAWMSGQLPSGEIVSVNVLPKGTRVANPAFDVTPARLVSAIITECGVYTPDALSTIQR